MPDEREMRLHVRSVGAIVLCGGRSARMGVDKASLWIGGETLLTRMVRIVSGVLDPVIVAARAGQALPDLPNDFPIVRDGVDDAGPLAGIAAGLDALDDRREAVFVCACDHPLLRPAVIRRLIESLGDADAAVPESNERRFPLTAVYRTRVRTIIDDLLARGERRAGMLVERCDSVIVPADRFLDVDASLESFRNVNDPAEFEALFGSRPLTGWKPVPHKGGRNVPTPLRGDDDRSGDRRARNRSGIRPKPGDKP